MCLVHNLNQSTVQFAASYGDQQCSLQLLMVNRHLTACCAGSSQTAEGEQRAEQSTVQFAASYGE
jgi:hypothetical protein